jgi:uncharacterized protein (DUF433 family)
MSMQAVKLNLSATPPSIEERDGIYYIAGSPITLAAVILRFQEGLSPDTIRRECFPSLPLSHVYSAVTFYLNNSEEVDAYLKRAKQEEDELQERLLTTHPGFIKTAEELRDRMVSLSEK